MFAKVWVRRGNWAISGTLLRQKRSTVDVFVYVNGGCKEVTVLHSDYVLANPIYWEDGLMTKWPVADGLNNQQPKNNIVLADLIYYPLELTAC